MQNVQTIKKFYEKIFTRQPFCMTYGWKEQDFQRHLAGLIGGILEFKCPSGRIDIINNHIVCEIKFASTHGNKTAIGQALCYTYYHPGYIPAIALIGEPENPVISEICRKYGIIYMFFYNGIWQISW